MHMFRVHHAATCRALEECMGAARLRPAQRARRAAVAVHRVPPALGVVSGDGLLCLLWLRGTCGSASTVHQVPPALGAVSGSGSAGAACRTVNQLQHPAEPAVAAAVAALRWHTHALCCPGCLLFCAGTSASRSTRRPAKSGRRLCNRAAASSRPLAERRSRRGRAVSCRPWLPATRS